MDIDPGLAILQAIPFLIAVIGLHFIIFKPMLALLAEREKNIFGFQNDADLLSEEVEAKADELDQKMAEARSRAKARREALRQETTHAEQDILARARRKVEDRLEGARARLTDQRTEAQAELRATTRQLAGDMATAVLGRAVRSK